MEYSEMVEKLKAPVVTGLLSFSGENLIYCKDSSNVVELKVAEMTRNIAQALATRISNEILDDYDIDHLGAIAQGLLASPHDNLKKAHARALKKNDHDMYHYFALSCFAIWREL